MSGCVSQGVDTESKSEDKTSKADSSVQFGGNTPTVSCTFDRESQNKHITDTASEPDVIFIRVSLFSFRIVHVSSESLCVSGQKSSSSG